MVRFVAVDLAIGLRAVGPGALVDDAGLGQRGGEVPGAVARAVVGQDPLDAGDAGLGEERSGAAPEPGRGVLAFVVEQFGVGQPRVVVDGVVQVGVARSAAPVAPARSASEDLVPAADGDVAQLLDVDVDHVAGTFVLVAADHPAGGPIEIGQPRHPVAAQHLVHRRGRDPQQEPDAGLAPPPGHPDLDDAPLGAGRGLAWAAVRARGPVEHAGLA
jgi:hypothetical protein